MIDKKQFETIKQKHGGYASWAVWADIGEKPKSNMGDMSILDSELNPVLLNALNNNVVMVGLNISRPFSEPLRNFHDPNPRANDFKIRYAFHNTKYYGAYMTDIIKSFEMIDSKNVRKHLKAHPVLIEKNVDKFREELRDLNSKAPAVVAFGSDAYKILYENLAAAEYSKLVQVTHYSHHISKEKYREMVLRQVDVTLT